jgi:hypothetical protein
MEDRDRHDPAPPLPARPQRIAPSDHDQLTEIAWTLTNLADAYNYNDLKLLAQLARRAMRTNTT